MSKDPAFLFYPADWMGGTHWMTMEQKGCYMELLCLQFNCGQFNEVQAKTVLHKYFASNWPFIKSKFILKDEFYFNERLRAEIERRRNYSESRRRNANKTTKGKASEYENEALSFEHMPTHMENENINENEDEMRNEDEHLKTCQKKKFEPPSLDEVIKFFKKNGYRWDIAELTFKYYSDADWHDSKGKPVLNWKQKIRGNWFKPEYRDNQGPNSEIIM